MGVVFVFRSSWYCYVTCKVQRMCLSLYYWLARVRSASFLTLLESTQNFVVVSVSVAVLLVLVLVVVVVDVLQHVVLVVAVCSNAALRQDYSSDKQA